MKASSPVQERSSYEGTVPPLERVRDDVWALGVAMPGGHIPYSLSYLLRDSAGGVHLVDPGWDSDENWASLCAALADLGCVPGDIRGVIVTHLHPDHLGMAQRVRRETDAPVTLHAAEQEALDGGLALGWTPERLAAELDAWGVPGDRRAEFESLTGQAGRTPPFAADVLVGDDERLDIPGFDLVTVWTPGHTRGHLCLRDDERSLLYTGDHLLPTMFAGLGLGGPTATNPLTDYLDSLDRVDRMPEHEALPGHGYRFTELATRVAESREHHLRRSREVAAVLAEGGDPTTWQIATRLTWTAGWDQLRGFYVYSALSQTAMHREYVES